MRRLMRRNSATALPLKACRFAEITRLAGDFLYTIKTYGECRR
jgi:hypothetical protein